jgi:hypothetical protein
VRLVTNALKVTLQTITLQTTNNTAKALMIRMASNNEGDVVDGKRHRKGTQYWSNGGKFYDGDWKEDNHHGK